MEHYLPFVAKHWHTIAVVGVSLFAGATIQRSLCQTDETNKRQLPLSKNAQKERVIAQQRKEASDEVVDEEDTGVQADDEADEEEALQIPFHYVRPSEADSIQRSAQFYSMMNLRRSVRSISRDSVPLAVIENIIKTGG